MRAARSSSAGARIDGDLLCGGGTFTNTIDARGIEVSGSVSLSDGFRSRAR